VRIITTKDTKKHETINNLICHKEKTRKYGKNFSCCFTQSPPRCKGAKKLFFGDAGGIFSHERHEKIQNN
jgi:hypothetical protein